MKKHALALAILSPLVAAPAFAEGPTLYGKLNVTLDKVENDTGAAATSTDAFSLNSNASRIGVKGDFETGIQDVKVLYYAEFGVKADDGAANGVSPFSQRNIWVGVKGDFGTVRAGKIDTPLKDSQGKVDQFNDLAADVQNLAAGEVRLDNVVIYSSPKIADAVTLNLAFAPGELRDLDNADGDANTATGREDGVADITSVSVVYEKDALYAALALAQNNSGSGNNDGFGDIDGATAGTQSAADIVRLTVGWKADAWEAGLLYQTAENVGGAAPAGEDAAWLLSGAWKHDKWKFKAQLGSNEGDTSKNERSLVALGADYALGKNTTLFGYGAEIENDPGAAAAVTTAVTTLAFGIDHKF